VETSLFFVICFKCNTLLHPGTDLGSAVPEAILVLGPQAGVAYLAVCLKSVNVCPSYVYRPLKNLSFVVPTLVLHLP